MTIYKEYKDDSEEVTSPDNDMNMSDDSFGVTKKKDNHVIPVLVVILLTVVMILLIVRYIQVRNQRKRRSILYDGLARLYGVLGRRGYGGLQRREQLCPLSSSG